MTISYVTASDGQIAWYALGLTDEIELQTPLLPTLPRASDLRLEWGHGLRCLKSFVDGPADEGSDFRTERLGADGECVAFKTSEGAEKTGLDDLAKLVAGMIGASADFTWPQLVLDLVGDGSVWLRGLRIDMQGVLAVDVGLDLPDIADALTAVSPFVAWPDSRKGIAAQMEDIAAQPDHSGNLYSGAICFTVTYTLSDSEQEELAKQLCAANPECQEDAHV